MYQYILVVDTIIQVIMEVMILLVRLEKWDVMMEIQNNDTIFNIDPRLGMSFDELQRLGIDEITPPVTGSGTGGSGV